MQAITVTQYNIDNGRMGNGAACPIANAFFDAGYKDVAVTVDTIRAWKNPTGNMPECTVYYTHGHAYNFISDFDGGSQVQPVTFNFYTAEEWDALKAQGKQPVTRETALEDAWPF